MSFISLSRRRGVLAAAACVVTLLLAPPPLLAQPETLAQQLRALEQSANGRLGVTLIDSGSLRELHYRSDERFAMASTFKTLVGAAVLQRSVKQPDLLKKRINYKQSDLVTYSPVTEKKLAQGMTIAELCAATIELSDNTAANLLVRELGGPQSITSLARELGDKKTRLDQLEPMLNSAIPGDARNTTTPRAMASNVQQLALGKALPAARQQQLITWLKQSKTGAESIRAGVPAGWPVGDKTGAGGYGTTNDVAIIWPPKGKPLILAIYFTQKHQHAEARRDVLASATRLVLAEWARG
ncbi:class A beta-lactamase [Erwiniaceae bacterium BAC15a-03b]|uniref:Beta-lactamase n=1 Tax=Winslowiella arboricola TaxID=2978220 RepID=A0A9J6PVQ2_9GAMM|nr:class A beta-lactamase [Winslowiella arboricola]MCU5772426.1 class A beta-lactamase [Winslowiella arboricola]MCU5779781.1 class A beta-lactamase [Winslowiella arboricola]